MDLGRNRVAGHPARRFNDLADAEAAAIAQVEDQPVLPLKRIQRQQVGVGQSETWM